MLTVDEPGNRLIAEQEDGVRGRVAASIDSSLDTCLVSLVVKGDPYSRREVVDIDGQGLPLVLVRADVGDDRVWHEAAPVFKNAAHPLHLALAVELGSLRNACPRRTALVAVAGIGASLGVVRVDLGVPLELSRREGR